LIGPVSDPVPYYLACDFVINSRIGAEPFGLSVVEAMMLGRPVLAHALGGPAETVVDGVTGWHTPDMSIASVTGTLERVMAERDRWQILGAQARERALVHFTLEAVAGRLLAMLREARPCTDRSFLAAARHAIFTPRDLATKSVTS
jgi:glycosyltransferase involved in cell wall biosynthesis